MERSRSRKNEAEQFARWSAGAHGNPSAETVGLYRRALICRAFPAYTLEAARRAGPDVLKAMQLLDIAQKVNS